MSSHGSQYFEGRIIDSWSRTRTNLHEFSHMWTIENFSFLHEEAEIVSPTFGSECDDGNQWRLKVYPNGLDGSCRDCVSVYLILDSSPRGRVVAQYKIVVMTSTYQAIQWLPSQPVLPVSLLPGQAYGFSRALRRDDLLRPNFLPGDVLKIYCELKTVTSAPDASGVNRPFPVCDDPRALYNGQWSSGDTGLPNARDSEPEKEWAAIRPFPVPSLEELRKLSEQELIRRVFGDGPVPPLVTDDDEPASRVASPTPPAAVEPSEGRSRASAFSCVLCEAARSSRCRHLESETDVDGDKRGSEEDGSGEHPAEDAVSDDESSSSASEASEGAADIVSSVSEYGSDFADDSDRDISVLSTPDFIRDLI